jgi:hypothetical protein
MGIGLIRKAWELGEEGGESCGILGNPEDSWGRLVMRGEARGTQEIRENERKSRHFGEGGSKERRTSWGSLVKFGESEGKKGLRWGDIGSGATRQRIGAKDRGEGLGERLGKGVR